ncbi:ABC transporter ATP-binding protein [Cohnella endophytica]|uniref:ABC transporter ATP-binding protein n=1 Tax=Cohnella endophytica TaxID=2419778 RepID=A0A494XHM8_9BACL|nr:ABC transporter ATP-binding protein [Cohnella endophytica]RKP50038.1 ABC transporter ATP-binding protein [Cohnella endophytica]
MKLVFHYLGKYRVAAIMAVFLMLVELTVELAQPLLISKIIDQGIARGDTSIVLLWSGILVGGSVIAFGAGILSSFYASHVSQSVGYELREGLYGKIQSFAYAVFNRFPTSSLITRLTNDVTQVQDTIFTGLRFMLRMPLVVVGSVIMALLVHVQLGFLLLLTVPVLVWFVIWMVKKAALLFSKVQQRLDTVNGVMQENLGGMRLIRVFVRRQTEGVRFARSSGDLMQTTTSAMRLTEMTQPFIVLIMNAGIIAVLAFGHLEIHAGTATTGIVVAIVNYSLRTSGALSTLSMLVSAFSRARASADRIGAALETDSEAESEHASRAPEGVRAGAVEFDRVTFRYPNTQAAALEDVNFSAKPGETVAILGATGSGKSSLIQLIVRLYEENEGAVRIDGRAAGEWNARQLHEAIGYVPQEVVLFTGTIRDNIAWGLDDVPMEKIEEAARQAQIHETIVGLPNGYETKLGQRGINLSGGQKQRISIARALVRRPAILLLDDSTSALDVRTEAALLGELENMPCTTFLVTQKISSTLNADLILLLDDGRLIAQGNHKQLMESSSLYRRIYASQFGEEDSHVGSAT